MPAVPGVGPVAVRAGHRFAFVDGGTPSTAGIGSNEEVAVLFSMVQLAASLPSVFAVLVAQVQVHADPSTDGLPGAAFMQRLLDWLGVVGLFLGLGSLLLGGGLWAVSQHMGYQSGSSTGRKAVLGGALAAILVGLGPAIVNGLYQAARG
jgi:hypothetical protein